MRLHALAGASVVLMTLASCGENLPPDAPPLDASIDPTSDRGTPVDAGLEADADECPGVPCNATVVANELPRALAASNLTVAWVRDNTDVRVLVDAAVEQKYTKGAVPLNGFVHVSGNIIYFSEGGGVRSCGPDPCTNPGAPMYGLSTLGPIASDTMDLFVVERDPPRRIARCSLAGGCGLNPRFVATVSIEARYLAVTATRLVIGMENGTIYSVLRTSELDGGSDAGDAGVASAQLVKKTNVLSGIAAEGTTLYFIDADEGKLLRCSITDCAAPKVLAEGLSTPRALVLEGEELYWTEEGSNAVKVCAKDACVPRVIARVAKPSLLALGDRIYVVSESERKVYASPRE